jgi:hypothetical protein
MLIETLYLHLFCRKKKKTQSFYYVAVCNA